MVGVPWTPKREHVVCWAQFMAANFTKWPHSKKTKRASINGFWTCMNMICLGSPGIQWPSYGSLLWHHKVKIHPYQPCAGLPRWAQGRYWPISGIYFFIWATLCTAFISYTERPISALSSIGEARAGLIWVDFNFVMSQQAPIRWSLNSWAIQANHGHPNGTPLNNQIAG